MAGARISVLLDIRSRLGGLDKALGGFKKLAGTVAGFAAAYLSTKAVVNGARDIIGLGAELNHLSAQTGIAESDLLTLWQAFSDNFIASPTHLSHPWTLNEMAESCGVGTTQFSKICRQITNMTPAKYLKALRMEAAYGICSRPFFSFFDVCLISFSLEY